MLYFLELCFFFLFPFFVVVLFDVKSTPFICKPLIPALESIDGSVPSSMVRAGNWGQKGRGSKAIQSRGAWLGVIPIVLSQSQVDLLSLWSKAGHQGKDISWGPALWPT